MKIHTSARLADVSLLFVALVWGATFVIVQNAIAFLQPLIFNGIRFFLAALFLFVWLLLFKPSQLKQLNIHCLKSGISLGLCLFIGYAFQTIGLVYTTSSKAGFITGLSVVLVPLFLYLFLKQALLVNHIIGVVIATIGLYLLTMSNTFSINIGDFFVFICAIGFALQIILTGKYSKEHPTLLLTIVQLLTVSVLGIMGSILFENPKANFKIDILLHHEVIIALLITSILATALAFIIQTSLQKYTNSTRVALIFATEPVFAAATAYLFSNEQLTTSSAIGCILILLGMIFAELPKKVLFAAFQKVMEK
ncbi:DMT family transporter [Niallia circulans]|uniref:DMT family transporter n=1 Tax=Niallia circulans TaxID=1397 RepID=A0A941GMS5_NIACI|nr:DMT family transporter [Niallia circulans]MCB5238813.1 DMT family transporter [Niallia circulans]